MRVDIAGRRSWQLIVVIFVTLGNYLLLPRFLDPLLTCDSELATRSANGYKDIEIVDDAPIVLV